MSTVYINPICYDPRDDGLPAVIDVRYCTYIETLHEDGSSWYRLGSTKGMAAADRAGLLAQAAHRQQAIADTENGQIVRRLTVKETFGADGGSSLGFEFRDAIPWRDQLALLEEAVEIYREQLDDPMHRECRECWAGFRWDASPDDERCRSCAEVHARPEGGDR
jgi:hypothetical protein